jgi:hypothetical protein
MSSCPTEEQLRQLLEGESVARLRESVETHVEACPACQEIVARLSAAEDGLDLRYLRGPGPRLELECDSQLVHRLEEIPLVERAPPLTEGTQASLIEFPGPPTVGAICKNPLSAAKRAVTNRRHSLWQREAWLV